MVVIVNINQPEPGVALRTRFFLKQFDGSFVIRHDFPQVEQEGVFIPVFPFYAKWKFTLMHIVD